MKKLKFLMHFCLLGFASVMWAQDNVSGVVTDEFGQPLPGSTVQVKGTTNGTTSDFDGNFVINAEATDVFNTRSGSKWACNY